MNNYILAFSKTKDKIISDDSLYGGTYTLVDSATSGTDRVYKNDVTDVTIKYIDDRWCITHNDNILAEASTKNVTSPISLTYINPTLPAGYPYELSSITLS